MSGRLEHCNYDTFRVRWDRAWRGSRLVQFQLGDDGEVERLDAGRPEFERRDPAAPDGSR